MANNNPFSPQQQRQASAAPAAPEIFAAVPVMASAITARRYTPPRGPTFQQPEAVQQRNINQLVRRR